MTVPLTLAEVRSLAREILVFFGRVLAAEQRVPVREAAVLLDNVAVQLGELGNGQEGLLQGR